MIVLDENIVQGQAMRLREFKIHSRQIGFDLGWRGMKDKNDVIPLLHRLKRPTFFTRDADFYKTDLCQMAYCLVFLDIPADEAAEYTRRLLRHSSFRAQAKRMGKVIRVRSTGVSWWEIHDKSEHALSW